MYITLMQRHSEMINESCLRLAWKSNQPKIVTLIIENSAKLNIDICNEEIDLNGIFNWSCVNGYTNLAKIIVKKSIEMNIRLNQIRQELRWESNHLNLYPTILL